MSATIHYTHCPVCNSREINPLLTLRDHSVSGEHFVIWQCTQCTLRFTQDVPDPTAIEKYYRSDAYISHTNTSKGLINKTYQLVRRFTLKEKVKLLTDHTGMQKGKLLDMGAGTGAFLQQMKNASWDVTGVEPDRVARDTAAKTFGLQLDSPEVLAGLQPKMFDAITLWHVLEHVHDLHPTISLLKNLLKDSGRLFVAVPNYLSADANAYRLNWAAYDVPRHLYHFTPASMELLMKRNGLRVLIKKRMWFDAFYISLLSSKYQNGKSNLPGAFITGLRSNIGALINADRCSSIIYIVGKA